MPSEYRDHKPQELRGRETKQDRRGEQRGAASGEQGREGDILPKAPGTVILRVRHDWDLPYLVPCGPQAT